MTEAVLVEGVRTPVGRYRGGLSTVRPDDLGALAISQLLERTGVPGSEINEVVFGGAIQAGEDNRNVARMSTLLAGLPVEVPAVTVNRLCASGLEAVAGAARRIMCGEADACVAGGVESMSRAPWVTLKPERGLQGGPQMMEDSTIGWRAINPRMEEAYGVEAMGETAENLAEKFSISREEQDRFSLHSHRKAVGAQDAGWFDAEITAVDTPDGSVAVDEGPRRRTSLEDMARLKPAFRAGGSVTAGNSSSLNDGAAALLVTSREYAEHHGLTPKVVFRACASAGVPPRIMGIGPVPASQKALDRLGLSLADMDLIELNEAFAAQALAVLREWQLDFEDDRLNPCGGAIAIGHPLGCSGARILTTLMGQFERVPEARLALVTMCVGVGQGQSLVLERAE